MNAIELKPGNFVIYEYRDSVILTRIGISPSYEGGIKGDDIEVISGTESLMDYWPIGEILIDKDNEIIVKEIFKDEDECYDKYPEYML